ncbi:carbon-nitrogen hydrolase family protein [Homoserinibacter sp. YIM 151385]|uniref:carbon-nitrogen hydrolase family protein n=1 Tax=Homoserinibacter sp. YIM 151385 TaxID=2985506 RepID=UPI0022F11909|nr:carbon-nitrogen hydrolase family protein [Homoserinibacter sp. YIM 151385]WBU38160.1 carbon-nitrogen hydrolase family protein [Homoserinibacter sp. YIM 151385]
MSGASASLAVAVLQYAPGPDREQNLAVIARLAERAAARGAELVVAPEYATFFTSKPGPELVAAAEPLDGPSVVALSALADRLGIHLVAGIVEATGETGRAANTVVAVAPGEGLVASYRKLHLYDAFGDRESDWLVPGEISDPCVIEVRGIRVGIQTCYDLRFPEVTRRLADAGAELVLVPSEWVRGPLKEHHWRTLVTARALENTLYVAAPDHAPPVGAGSSLIVDPMGTALASLGEHREEVAVATVERSRVEEVRERNPALRLRRFRVVPVDPA